MKNNNITIYLVRHAESTGNKEGRLCGKHADFPLSEKGYEQANLVANALINVCIDKIYSSPMQRALQTAVEIEKLQQQDININIINEFNEMEFGDLDGKLHKDIYNLYPVEHHNWTTVKRYPEGFPGQESVEDAQMRFSDALKNILENDNDSNNILITTHGTILRLFTGMLLGYSKNELKKLPSSRNTAITKILFDKKTKKFHVIDIANSSHLK